MVAAGLPRGLRLAGTEFPLEHPHAHHMLRGTLEIPVQEALRRHLGPGATLFDIGANVGFFSLIGARLAGPSGRVHAFEPLPANVARIRAHAAANGFAQVEVREVALGEESGRATLSVPEEGSWAHLERYAPDRDVPGKLDVEVTTVDALVEGGRTRPPDVVKIDAEGAEVEILRGMEATLGAHRPAVICEMHGRNAEFVGLAESLGYSVSNLEGTEPPAEAHENVHVLARPG